jgi:hypothetical protein
MLGTAHFDSIAYARMQWGMDDPNTGTWRTHKRGLLRKRKKGVGSPEEPMTIISTSSVLREVGACKGTSGAEPEVSLTEATGQGRLAGDMNVRCRECASNFNFSVEEQHIFAEKGWPIPRQRCEACTLRRKESKRSKGKLKDGRPGLDSASSRASAHTSGDDHGLRPRCDPPPDTTEHVDKMRNPELALAAVEMPFAASSAGQSTDGRTVALVRRRGPGGVPEGVCYNCGEGGHLSLDCPQPRSGGRGPSGGKTVCYRCHKEGHRSFECSLPDAQAPSGGKGTGMRNPRPQGGNANANGSQKCGVIVPFSDYTSHGPVPRPGSTGAPKKAIIPFGTPRR